MRWWLTAVLIVTGCLATRQAIAERRVALVVGNSQYAYTSTLLNPRNDAEDIASALGKVGFEVTVGYDLDQVNFAITVAEFARKLEGADVGLFFYAGHGLQIDGKNYLVSTQAKLENTFLVSSETMELDNVIRMMESKTGISLIFLDACRNNPLADNLRRNVTSVNRALTVGRGLAPIAPGRDTLVAFSAASGEVAADGGGRNSPFAASLLQHLTQPGLEISVMLKEVTADVRRATNNVQRPQQFSDMSKTFYFVKAEQAAAAGQPVAPPPPVPLPSPPVAPVDPIELAFWQSAFAANECESVRAYLRQYPDGRFAALGRVSERRLCKAGPDAAPPPAPAASPAATLVPPSVSAADSPPAASVATAPAEPLPSGTSVARQTVAPDPVDVTRRLQKELARVGCAPPGIETESTWGAASREALRQFNERTHAVATLDQPTPEALLEAVQSYKDRVCPLTCEPGAELRGDSCVEVPRDPAHHGSRPPRHERPDRERAPRAGEPRRADSGPRPATREEFHHDERRRAPPQFHEPAVRDCIHVTFPQCSPR